MKDKIPLFAVVILTLALVMAAVPINTILSPSKIVSYQVQGTNLDFSWETDATGTCILQYELTNTTVTCNHGVAISFCLTICSCDVIVLAIDLILVNSA